MATSADGGISRGRPVIVSDFSRDGATHDNTAIAASATAPGVAYLTSTRFEGDSGPAGVARAVDGGETWTPLRPAPVPGPAGPRALAPQPLVGDGDEV